MKVQNLLADKLASVDRWMVLGVVLCPTYLSNISVPAVKLHKIDI